MDKYYGKIISKVEGLQEGSDQIKIFFEDGSYFWMQHFQDCCESVYVHDIDQDRSLIGATWHGYDESSSAGESEWGSATWTFYRIATSYGVVWIRWLGESNGYYSESVYCGYCEEGDAPSQW